MLPIQFLIVKKLTSYCTLSFNLIRYHFLENNLGVKTKKNSTGSLRLDVTNRGGYRETCFKTLGQFETRFSKSRTCIGLAKPKSCLGLDLGPLRLDPGRDIAVMWQKLAGVVNMS